ncbi:DUF968 domain-containing protein, partial [Salmonella enterica]|uniref:DUF968 domain-containing protein n=1 Tax=Salmonella enterica TaxID=28901 RepID=UPI0021B1E502
CGCGKPADDPHHIIGHGFGGTGCGCGKTADDPHHIIGHGFGGTGTKACDLLVIPLCRVCHEALHADTRGWEEQNGSQLLWLARTLARATGTGAITAARAKQ